MSANASGKVAKKIALFEIRPPGTEQNCRLKRKHAIRRKRYIRERRSISNDNSYFIPSLGSTADDDSVEKVSSEFSASCSALQLIDDGGNYNRSNRDKENHSKTISKLLRSSSLDDFINISRDRDKKGNYLHLVDINIEDDHDHSTKNFSFNDENEEAESLYENAKPEILSVSDHFKVNRLNDKNKEMMTTTNNSQSARTNYSYDSGTHSHSNSQLSNYSRDLKAENFYENIVPRYLLSVQAGYNQTTNQHDIHDDGHEEESSSVKRKSGLDIIQSLMLSMGGPPRITGSSEDIYTNATSLSESDRIKSNSDPEAIGRLADEDEPLYEDLYDYYMSSCCSDRNCDSSLTTSNNYNNNSQKNGPTHNSTSVCCTNTNTTLNQPKSIVPPTRVLLDIYSRNSSKDKNDPDVPTPCSSRPPTPPPYESLYSEPIYGETGAPVKTIPSSPPSLYNSSQKSLNFPHSSSSSTSNYGESNHLGLKSRIISTTVRKDSIYHPSVASSSGSNTSGGFYNDSVSGIYGFSDKLPPTPPNKFSSIAKSAGRKIAKRFLQIRRISRTSLEHLESPALSLSSSTSGTGSTFRDVSLRTNTESPYSNNSSSNSTSSSSGCKGIRENKEPMRRQISRPSIPPPEPPKNEVSNAIQNSDNLNENCNNRKSEESSIYRSYAHSLKSSQNHEAEDDYDDSDFYDSDSDLIRNFVSQVQPIYSMEEEPLYQYYTYGISLKPEDDYQPVIPKNLGLTLDMLVPRVGQRTLWCELPEVMASGILAILSDKQKQLQEAIFEILTSEVSYIKSLDVLITLFYKHEELVGVLTEEERGYLFGNITDVKDCAQAFLAELLAKWEESWYIQEIGEIVNSNANTRFSVYMDYCRNKPYQDKTMQRLRHSRDEFVSVIKTIEEDPKCQMLRMDSFLMLPMQRITRLPLLVNAVLQRTQSAKEKAHCEEALKNLTNLVLACNDAARESQDAEETAAIVDKIEFPRGLKNNFNMGQFVMKGDFMKNPFDQGRGQLNWTFRKTKRTFYWLLLFHNQLLITKKKANGKFEVLDMVLPSDSNIKPLPNLEGVSKDFQHFFMLHFNRKETVYFLAARTNSEIERWKTKLETMKTRKDLKVEAIFPYDARRDDELSFHVGDLIQVSQMQPDVKGYSSELLSLCTAFIQFLTISSISVDENILDTGGKQDATSISPLDAINIEDSDSLAQPGWVRFCQEDQQTDFFSHQCEAGMWWKPNNTKIKEWDCVCMRGPWRWNSGWCSNDESQKFTQGDLTCFTPESNIEGIFYLGDPLDINAPSPPYILTSYTSGFILQQNDFFEAWKVDSTGIKDIGVLVYNPIDDWSVKNRVGTNNITLCLRLPELGEVSDTQGLFIYNVSLLYQTEMLDENEQGLQAVFNKGCTDYNNGGIWFEVYPESIYDKNMVVPPFDRATASEACQICSANIPIVQSKLKRQLDETTSSESNDFTAPDLKNGTLLSTEVNLQSERIGLYWAKRLFRNESDYLLDDLQEIDILVKAAIMAYGTCDMNYIPKHFYQYFLLMFRQLLSESFKKYSPMAPIPDDYYSEINSLLENCKSRMRPITFKNAKGCPFKYAQWTNGTAEQSTEPPDGYRASKDKHDYLVEFVWKLKEFLHYNCFEEFKNNSVLHDIIQHQIEALFTEDILLRWSNPSKSFEMYDAIFKVHFSLESTMYNFEGCIKAVHDMSQYSVWLKRPIEQPHRHKRSIRSSRELLLTSKDDVFNELEINSKLRRIKRSQVDVEDWSPEETDYNDEESVETKRTIRQTSDLWMAANQSATCLSKVDTFIIAAGFSSFSGCW